MKGAPEISVETRQCLVSTFIPVPVKMMKMRSFSHKAMVRLPIAETDLPANVVSIAKSGFKLLMYDE